MKKILITVAALLAVAQTTATAATPPPPVVGTARTLRDGTVVIYRGNGEWAPLPHWPSVDPAQMPAMPQVQMPSVALPQTSIGALEILRRIAAIDEEGVEGGGDEREPLRKSRKRS